MSNNLHHAVILDSRTHRIVRLGENFATTEGYHVSIARSKDAAGKDEDQMIWMGPKGSYRFKVTGLHVPPHAGGAGTLTEPAHQFPVVLDPNVHRIIPLGKELSGDPDYSVVYENKAAAGAAEAKDEITFKPRTNGGGSGTGGGGKIPPNTGA